LSRAGQAWSIAQLRQLARARLPRPVFDFYEGGAEDEQTLRANEAAFEALRLVPRCFVDVSQADTSVSLLGADARLPLAIAPMGAVAYGWRDGDLALARAARAAGVPYTLSTMAAAPIEQVAQVGGRLWFQAHLLLPRERTLGLIERARAANYEALVITGDLPVGGKRERDLRNQLAMPFRMQWRHLVAFALRPGWSLPMLLQGAPRPPEVARVTAGSASSIGGNFDPGFDWTALEDIRRRWPRKLVLKGILHPADARRAVALGADAVIVSNHGGRQLDGCIATMEALPRVAEAVQGRAQVLVDGGIRRGRDILKAMLAGADGVLVGRAPLYGLSAAGEEGARRAIEILGQELTTAMQLCGMTSLRELERGAGSLRTAEWPRQRMTNTTNPET
jgi:(S)-mandelate dehydrogenase